MAFAPCGLRSMGSANHQKGCLASALRRRWLAGCGWTWDLARGSQRREEGAEHGRLPTRERSKGAIIWPVPLGQWLEFNTEMYVERANGRDIRRNQERWHHGTQQEERFAVATLSRASWKSQLCGMALGYLEDGGWKARIKRREAERRARRITSVTTCRDPFLGMEE